MTGPAPATACQSHVCLPAQPCSFRRDHLHMIHADSGLVPCRGLRLRQLVKIMSACLHNLNPSQVANLFMIQANHEQTLVPCWGLTPATACQRHISTSVPHVIAVFAALLSEVSDCCNCLCMALNMVEVAN